VRAAHQGAQLELTEPRLQAAQLGIELILQARVFFAQLAERADVDRFLLQRVEGIEQAVERLQLGDDGLRLLGAVPEVRLAHLGVELFALGLLGGDVKESPAGGSGG
jgi:hypothetical protein